MIPEKEQALLLARQANVVPICREVLADTETPVSAYGKISAGAVNSFLLESVEGGERIARYSFIGIDPFLEISSTAHTIRISGRENRVFEGDPIAVLREYVDRYTPAEVPDLPPFTGGAVGYFGYDTIRLVESIPETVTDDLGAPELLFGFYDTVVAFDNRKHRMMIVSNMIMDDGTDPEEEYRRVIARINDIEKRLKSSYVRPFKQATRVDEPVSNFLKEDFKKAVLKCKDYIRAGDIFQVVLSQRFAIKTDADPFDIYRMLRIVNPSPYNFFLKLDDMFLVGSSPELLVKSNGSRVVTRPLAGTRKRGKSEEEDKALEEELLADPKERAEHIMLVDLGRNDIGRVAKYGTVCPEKLMQIERYSHVMHISSTVAGELREDKDRFDALFSCLPAGTLSGAPKIRAMEIIDELEPTKRLTYGGAIGYLDFSGNIDSCITIRTIYMKGDTAYIQVGAGIVADSDPESEYEETRTKARAMIKAIDLVRDTEV